MRQKASTDMDISTDIHVKSVDMDTEVDEKFHIQGKPDFTCRNGNGVRCRTFSKTCDINIKLVFCSWLQSWHSLRSSTHTGVDNLGR